MKVRHLFIFMTLLGYSAVSHSEILTNKCGTLSGTISLSGSPYKIKIKDTNKYYLIESDGLPEDIRKQIYIVNSYDIFLEGEYQYCQLYTLNESVASRLTPIVEITSGKVLNAYTDKADCWESDYNCIEFNLNYSFKNALSKLTSEGQKQVFINAQNKWKDWVEAECEAIELRTRFETDQDCKINFNLDRTKYFEKFSRRE